MPYAVLATAILVLAGDDIRQQSAGLGCLAFEPHLRFLTAAMSSHVESVMDIVWMHSACLTDGRGVSGTVLVSGVGQTRASYSSNDQTS